MVSLEPRAGRSSGEGDVATTDVSSRLLANLVAVNGGHFSGLVCHLESLFFVTLNENLLIHYFYANISSYCTKCDNLSFNSSESLL